MVWAARRILVSLLLVWIVVSIVFLVIRAIPGDPAELLLSQGGSAPSAEIVAQLHEQLGLDRPLLAQYTDQLRRMLSLDLGNSLEDETPVAEEVFHRLPRTLELIFAAAILALATGLPAGLAAGLRPRGWFDAACSWFASLALATPIFVLGTVVVLVFAQWLRLVPAGGYVPFARAPLQHLGLLAMPAGTIALGLAAVVFRMTRACVLDVAQRDYVRTARAKGLLPWLVVLHHVLRNALMPVVTVIALHLGSLLGGTVLVEYVFNYPGLSGLLVQAVNARDYPMVQGIVLVISVLFVTLNLAVDLIYAVLDPRVRRA